MTRAMARLVNMWCRAKGSCYGLTVATGLLPRSLSANLLISALILDGRTAVSLPRLRQLRLQCLRHDLPSGAFVECGVGNGGCVALMAHLADRGRLVWGFDSFEPMPTQTAEDVGDGARWVGHRCCGPDGELEVVKTLSRYGLRRSVVRIVKGWFEQTIPGNREAIGPIAILRLDSDWYASTRYCLEQLYESVQRGGIVIVDDYHTFEGCRRAVDEFRINNGIDSELITTDARSEVYWQK